MYVRGDEIAFRVDDAVRVSGLSRSSLYLLMANGELPAIKAGGRRLILRADLEKYFEGLRAAEAARA
jgi:excisionase family DNA binding protein